MDSLDNTSSRPGAELFLLMLMHKILVGELIDVPHWAQHVAMDDDGELYAFSHPPRINPITSCWVARRGYSALIEAIGCMAPHDREWLDWEECCVRVARLVQPACGQNGGRMAMTARLQAVDEMIADHVKDAWI